MVHLGHGAQERIDFRTWWTAALTLIESTSPSALLAGSLDAACRLAATRGRELLDETLPGARLEFREAIREIEGLDVLDERPRGRPRAFMPTTRCAWPSTCAARVPTATRWPALLRYPHADIGMELAGENVIVGVFGMAEPAPADQGRRLVAALDEVVASLGERGDRTRRGVRAATALG